MQKRTATPRHQQHSPNNIQSSDAKFDFSRLIANLSPVDVLAILGFAFLGCWTLWFSVQCLLISMYVAMAISLVASIVFFICSAVLIKARIQGPYMGDVYDDLVCEAHCYARMLGTRDPATEDDDETKECTIYCRKRCLTLNFNDAWKDDILWSNVVLVDSYGSKTLTLDLPRYKGRIRVKFLFDSAEDRMNVENCCKRFVLVSRQKNLEINNEPSV